ncbi:hypothetical protein OIDMADRAFT_20876 [Oidiodendron maius Zn]|uniref:Uncharacterized protein n=1 Tax=Oidiodendron maius (strain Zn) TaxID=913774 RepID=A0A0C3GID0_OIDMZ|nr:hypothetical protein OIDMADRAFT_20876 [Oidiodendron maius Zn]
MYRIAAPRLPASHHLPLFLPQLNLSYYIKPNPNHDPLNVFPRMTTSAQLERNTEGKRGAHKKDADEHRFPFPIPYSFPNRPLAPESSIFHLKWYFNGLTYLSRSSNSSSSSCSLCFHDWGVWHGMRAARNVL